MNPVNDRSKKSNHLLARLARWLGFGWRHTLDEVLQGLTDLRASVVGLADEQTNNATGTQETVTTLQKTVARLEKQIGRVGREQFKANAVNEATQQRIQTTLAHLRQVEAHREKELAALRERLARQQAGERLKVVERLFPVLDGLHEALQTGEKTLNDVAPTGAEAQPAPGFGDRLRAAWQVLAGQTLPDSPVATNEQRETLAAWLAGVEFVHDRLLAVLENESVKPIEAVGQPFDPRRHLAAEVVPATNGIVPGQVVRELRRGYAAGEMVLRYAEVVVARDLKPSPEVSRSSEPVEEEAALSDAIQTTQCLRN